MTIESSCIRQKDRRLKILFLGWARLELEEREAGGLNLFSSALASALVAAGHSVSYLRTVSPRSEIGVAIRSRIDRDQDWSGIRLFRATGAPYRRVAWQGSWWPTNPQTEHGFTKRLIEFVNAEGFDVVHFQTTEGWGLQCIRALREQTRAKVFLTMHDFFAVCEQSHFYQFSRAACFDSKSGMLCASCRSPQHQRYRWLRFLGRRVLPLPLRRPLMRTARTLLRVPGTMEILHTPGSQSSPLADLNSQLFSEMRPKGPISVYQVRREEHVGYLNDADSVIVTTDFMKRAFESAGVASEKLLKIQLGHPLLDEFQKTSRQLPASDVLRLAYIGSTYSAKGLDTVLAAARLLKDLRGRISIQIHSTDPLGPFVEKVRDLDFVTFHEGFKMAQLAEVATGYDIGIVAHKCFESCGYTLLQHLALRKRVILSRMGGGVEHLAEGQGLLVPPDSPSALADAVRSMLAAPLPDNSLGWTKHRAFPDLVRDHLSAYSSRGG